METIFKTLLLIARPAAGKSEIINYLNNLDVNQRKQVYHIGKLDVIDDFEMLWTWFEEDKLLEKMGYPRLHTDADEYFIGNHLWDLLIERISLEYQKRIRDINGYHNDHTTLIEFSRGKEHGGYKNAFNHLSDEILANLAIMYINVSWDESLRKNIKRFNPERPDSILEHSLSLSKMEKLYKESDWFEIVKNTKNYIKIRNFPVPFTVFENEDDVTSSPNDTFAKRLKTNLNILWELYIKR